MRAAVAGRTAIAAIVLMGATGALQTGCGGSPTTPTTPKTTTTAVAAAPVAIASNPGDAPTVTGVTFASLVPPQTVTVAGTGFQSGLTLTINPSGGAPFTINGTLISNLTPTSFQAHAVGITTAGPWSFQVANTGGTMSNVFTTSVQPSLIPQVQNVGTQPFVARAAPQVIHVAGVNFLSGLALTVTSPGGGTSASNITNIQQGSAPWEASFDATVTIPTLGTYSLQVTNPGFPASNVETLTVDQGAGSPLCVGPDPPPYLGNSNGERVPQEAFADVGTGVGIYASFIPGTVGGRLCGNYYYGPCPFLDSYSVSGSCVLNQDMQPTCGCSLGFEAHFIRTALIGTCTATFVMHDGCGVSGTSTLTFALPPPRTESAPFDPSVFLLGAGLLSIKGRAIRRFGRRNPGSL